MSASHPPEQNKLASTELTYDGMMIHPFPGMLKDGPERRFQAIRDLDTNADDIILATYARSGILFIPDTKQMHTESHCTKFIS